MEDTGRSKNASNILDFKGFQEAGGSFGPPQSPSFGPPHFRARGRREGRREGARGGERGWVGARGGREGARGSEQIPTWTKSTSPP